MTKRTGRVTCELSISADGYSAGLNQTEQRPFGDDGGDGWGGKLHAWMSDTAGENRDEAGQMTAARAFIIGRNMFGPVRGEWDRQWNGWRGDDPPFHAPVFVVTHRPRPVLQRLGGTSFTYVTAGVASAIDQARAVAGGKNVAIAGGGTLLREVIKLGLVDELELHIAPVSLGDGMRLLDADLNLDSKEGIELTPLRVISSEDVTHLRYKVNGRATLVLDYRAGVGEPAAV